MLESPTTNHSKGEPELPSQITIDSILSNFDFDLKARYSGGYHYYYSYISNPFVKKEIYVGKVTDNRKKVLEYYLKILAKEFEHTFQEISNRSYDLQVLHRKEALFVDLYRFLYDQSLSKYTKSDLSLLETKRYTAYVQGSTSVEGNTYDLTETHLTLNKGITVGGKSAREFFEINNYGKLKNYLKKFEDRSINIDVDFIKKLHYFILNEIDDENAGQFRGINVGIIGSNFSPTLPFEIEDELEELCQWYKSSRTKLHPVELIGIFHHRFEQIHPFVDGNGRVGREIMRLQLKEFNLPSIFINTDNRAEYIKSLNQSDQDNLAPLIRLIFNLVSQELLQLVYELYMELEVLLSHFPEDLFNHEGIDESIDEFIHIIGSSEVVMEPEVILDKLF